MRGGRACQRERETAFPVESRDTADFDYVQIKSISVRTYDYPQGDSNECQNTRENRGIQGQGGTDSGTPADAGKVEALAAALLSLSPADRERLAAMLAGQGG